MRLLVTLFMLLLPIMPQAHDGADGPAFIAARDAWLRDDEQGLRDLVDLARAGNDAATILAEGIDSLDYLNRRPRDRTKRIPIAELAARSEFASAFVAGGANAGPELRKLADLGEPGRAFMRSLRLHGGALLTDVVSAPNLAPDLRAYALMLGPQLLTEDVLHRLSTETCDADPFLYEQFAPLSVLCQLRFGEEWMAAYKSLIAYRPSSIASESGRWITKWLAEDRRTAPYRRVCDASCGAVSPDCLGALYFSTFGFSTFMTLRSPAETLITQAEFVASERASGILWRSLRASLEDFSSYPGIIRNTFPDAVCLLEAMNRHDTTWDREYSK